MKTKAGMMWMKIIGIKQLNEFVELYRSYGYDVPLGVSGPEQSGKSTLAMQCSREKLGIGDSDTDKFFKFLDKNVIFNPADIWKIRNLPDHAEVPVDEAIRVAWRREFYRPENRWLVKLFRQFGRARRVYYLNIPKFWSLDDEILNDRIKVWVHVVHKEVKLVDGKPVPTKFHAILFKKDYHAYQDDPWMKRQARKILKEENDKIGTIPLIPHDISRVIRRYVRLPSFQGYIKFDPLPGPLWKVYDEYSLEKKLSYEKRSEDIDDKWRLRFYTMVYNLHNRGMSRKEIERLLEIDEIPLLEGSWISQNWSDIVDLVTSGSSKELSSVKHQRKIAHRKE